MELDLSPNFNLEDIRKVRDHYYEITKSMTLEEERKYSKAMATSALAEIECLRAAKKAKEADITEMQQVAP